MSIYREIPSATFREVEGVKYFVRKFGYNGVVFEEELVPLPVEKIIHTMKVDGTENISKQRKEAL